MITENYLVLNKALGNNLFGLLAVKCLSSSEPNELWSCSCPLVCSTSGVYWSSVADGKRCSDNVITRGGVDTRTGLSSWGCKIELSNIISRGAVRVPIKMHSMKFHHTSIAIMLISYLNAALVQSP